MCIKLKVLISRVQCVTGPKLNSWIKDDSRSKYELKLYQQNLKNQQLMQIFNLLGSELWQINKNLKPENAIYDML